MKSLIEIIRAGKLSRGRYAAWGIALVLLKYNIDRLIAKSFDQASFLPITSWTLGNASRDPSFFFILALTAIPFAVVGVILTIMRLRSAAWPAWLVILFFAPVLNLIFFALLCWLPSSDQPRTRESAGLSGWLRWILPHGSVATATVALAISAILTVFLAWGSTAWAHSYGYGLFYALPFASGLISVILATVRGPRSYRFCVQIALLTVVVAGALLFALAIEGAICLLMAAPIGLVMAWLGGTVGYCVQAAMWRLNQSGPTLCVVLAVLPGIFTFEEKTDAPLRSCVTEVCIAAPPENVWEHVVEFSVIPPPKEWIFHTGIAYPIEAVIEGRGVGAIRRCRFSTGDFVEPITAWEQPHRLAFSVDSQPEPMQEASPYGHVHPPHLEGFMISERGEFQLVGTKDGGTILRGTTWYRQRLWPQAYWIPFSDYLIHSIHRRVLEHIQTEAEGQPKKLAVTVLRQPFAEPDPLPAAPTQAFAA